MTVPSEQNSISHAGNGISTVFPIPYYFLEATDLVVTLVDSLGAATVLIIGSDYTITGAGNQAGGSLTATVAPPNLSTLVIERSAVPATQETDYVPNDPFPAESHERALDKLTMLIQQNQLDVTHAIRVPSFEAEPNVLPIASVRAGKLLAFDPNGSPIVVSSTPESATDLEIRLADFSNPNNGAGMVGYKNRTVYSRLSDRASFEDAAPAGDGATDDLAKMNAMIASAPTREIMLANKQYRVSARPTNPLGIEFEGKGVVGLPITGGLQQLNSYADKHKYAIGKEYLNRCYQYLELGQSGSAGTLRVFMYGDSTVAGGQGEGGQYLPHVVVQRNALQKGIGNIAVTNRGVSGTKISDMNAIPDISPTSGLFIIKYGINDGTNPEATRLTTFATDLRAKLAQIRATTNGGLDRLAILLVGPNSTSDTPNGRDERWYEQLRGIYVQAARDYQCAYFDTYAWLKDSRGAASLWMDNPYGDGRAIHPLNAMNAWIWGGIWDWAFSFSDVSSYRSNQFTNVGAVNGLALPSTLPSQYPRGVSIQRATIAGGWPEDGIVITTAGVDEVTMQQMTPFAANRSRLVMRSANVGSDSWNQWTGSVVPLTFVNSWVDYGAPGSYATCGATITADGLVKVQGAIKNGVTAAGNNMAVLPVGYRPAQIEYFPVYSNGTLGWVSVDTSGNIASLTTMSATLVTLSSILFRAA